MKKVSIALLLMATVVSISSCKETKKKLAPQEHATLIIPYGSYNDRPVELEYDSLTKRLTLRIATTSSMSVNDDNLNYLKNEVVEITSTDKTIDVADGKYRLVYSGRYPTWGPYTAMNGGKGNDYSCLLFSEQTELRGRKFYVWGNKVKKPGYYGYSN